MNQTVPSKHQRINAIALRNLVWALLQGPHDYYELAEITGLSRTTIRRWLSPWRLKTKDCPRLLTITAWNDDPRGYPTRPAFEFKPNASDAAKIVKKATEKKRRQRARKGMQRMIQMTAGQM